MLTVLLTVLFALYILGPDLVGRWIVGFFAPSRARARSYGEQITTACILSVLPITLAWQVAKYTLHIYTSTNKVLLAGFIQGVLGADSFDKHASAFYKALPLFFRLNLICLAVVYGAVLLLAFYFGRQLKHFGEKIRQLKGRPRRLAVLNFLVKPWVSEWHLRLSGMLLPNDSTTIQADVLTSMNILYRGNLISHHLGSDGALASITLEDARKFRREEFLKRRAEQSKKLSSEDFWTAIGGQFLVMRADQIATLNIRYVEATRSKLPSTGADEFIQLLDEVAAARRRATLPPGAEKFQ